MRDTTRESYRERVLRVLVHVQQNLDEAVSLERLAEIAGFSPFHFHRVFRGMVGETLVEHVRRLRLERAAMRLKHTELPVTSLAFEAGYETHEAFTRAFAALFGAPPSRFRSERRVLALPAVPSGVHYGPAEHAADLRLSEAVASGPEIEVCVDELEPARVAFLRHVGPYDECGDAWDRFVTWMGSEGLLGGDTEMFALCHDDPDVTAPERIRYDVCATVGADFEPVGEIGVQVVAGGLHAVATHQGPYGALGDLYLALFGCWLPTSGFEPRSLPCREVYLNDPESTEPDDLLTDICLPVRRVP